MRIENRDKRHASLIRSINNKNIKHLEYMQKEYEITKVNVQFYTHKSKQQERNIIMIISLGFVSVFKALE
jgi:hypothetical protein